MTRPGVTATTINIGEIADVGGPVPGLFQGAQYGIQAWAAYVNASGGIDGRKVKITLDDSALNCNTYMADLASLGSSSFASVGSFAIFDSCGKNTLTAHPGFPDVQAAVETPSLISLPNVFAPAPAPSGSATTGFQYVKDKFPSAITHTAGLYGSAVTQIFDEESNAAKSIGYKYLYSRGFGNSETNFTSDVLRMKSEGIKVVDMQDADAIQAANFLQEAAQQNLQLDAVISAAAYDPTFFTLLGTHAADADSLIMPLPTALYLGQDNGTVATVASFVKYLGITHPGTKPNLFAVDAFASGLLFEQAMKAAGSQPSRAAVINQLTKVTSFDAGGLIGPTNPGAKVPGVCLAIAGVSNGAFVRLKPPNTGYECDGTFVPYSAG